MLQSRKDPLRQPLWFGYDPTSTPVCTATKSHTPANLAPPPRAVGVPPAWLQPFRLPLSTAAPDSRLAQTVAPIGGPLPQRANPPDPIVHGVHRSDDWVEFQVRLHRDNQWWAHGRGIIDIRVVFGAKANASEGTQLMTVVNSGMF